MMGRHDQADGCSLCPCQAIRIVDGRDGPPDPSPSMTMGAVATHQMFEDYVTAGFTREEALHLVTSLTVEAVRRGMG